jgi:hypothetical protein
MRLFFIGRRETLVGNFDAASTVRHLQKSGGKPQLGIAMETLSWPTSYSV